MRGGFESFERREAENLENEGIQKYGLKAEGAEKKANAEFGDQNTELKDKEKILGDKSENNEKGPEQSYETSVKKWVDAVKEREEAEKQKNTLPNGETTANQNLETGLEMAWP